MMGPEEKEVAVRTVFEKLSCVAETCDLWTRPTCCLVILQHKIELTEPWHCSAHFICIVLSSL